MELNITREVAAMQRMTAKQLRVKYAEVFDDGTNANNRTWLIRRIAWRLQSLAEGSLSERSRGRAAELACDADLRLNPPTLNIAAQLATLPATRTVTRETAFASDDRLPPPGTILTRKYKGSTVQVKVLVEGFEYGGEVYGSLSAVAKAITGSHCNGFAFFGLNMKGGAA